MACQHTKPLALDALEYVSLGIVKDVLKMKVLSMEEFDSLNTELNKAKTDLDSLNTELNKAKTDLDSLNTELNKAKTDLEAMTFDKTNVGAASQEWREKLKTCVVKVSGLEEELAAAKAAVGTTEAAPAEETKTFAVGDIVKGDWQMEGKYYRGVVTAVEGDNITIKYDDDGSSETLLIDSVRAVDGQPTSEPTYVPTYEPTEEEKKPDPMGFNNPEKEAPDLMEFNNAQQEGGRLRSRR